MRKKLLLSTLTIGCLCIIATADSARGGTRISEDISSGWRFLRADAAGAESPDYVEKKDAWQDVNLPHTWNAKDIFDDEPDYYRGIGWYRKQLDVPQNLQGQTHRAAFRGRLHDRHRLARRRIDRPAQRAHGRRSNSTLPAASNIGGKTPARRDGRQSLAARRAAARHGF